MSDGLHPTGPSQPGPNTAYEVAGNPTQKEPVEASRAHLNSNTDQNNVIAHRGPSDTGNAEPVATSRGRGVHGAPPGEETKGYTQASYDSAELDAEQMGAPGEGKVKNAVQNKPGASGSQPGMETDIEKKKAEQAPARQKVQEEERKDLDVKGILGQRSAPADAVEKGNYPNSGD